MFANRSGYNLKVCECQLLLIEVMMYVYRLLFAFGITTIKSGRCECLQREQVRRFVTGALQFVLIMIAEAGNSMVVHVSHTCRFCLITICTDRLE